MATAKLPDIYPTNTSAPKEKKVEKVVHGTVTEREKPLGHKLASIFLSGDVNAVKRYLVYDVLIPSLKETVYEFWTRGLEMMLFNDSRPLSKKSETTKVSYRNFYSGDSSRRHSYRDDKHESDDTRDFIFESRGEAEEVLSNLVDLISDYGIATRADLFDLVGKTGNFTDNKWGWENLASSSVDRVRDGYRLSLPKAKYLD